MRSSAKLLLAGCCLVCAPAFAGLTLITTQSGLGANDTTLWSQLGGDGTVLTGPFSATSMHSVGVTGNFSTDNTGFVAVVCAASPSCSWGPDTTGMTAGDTDLWAFDGTTSLGTGPITLSFSKGLFGAGAWFQGDTTGSYTAAIQAFNGNTSLGAASTESSDAGGDPIFIGLLDTSAVITKIQFSLTSCAGCSNLGDFAIDKLKMTDPAATTPEPSSVLLFGSGFAWLGWTLRRKSDRRKV